MSNYLYDFQFSCKAIVIFLTFPIMLMIIIPPKNYTPFYLMLSLWLACIVLYIFFTEKLIRVTIINKNALGMKV